MRSGEGEDEALKREAEEEYRLKDVFKFQLKGKKIYNREVRGRKENHYFVLYEIYTVKKPILNEESVGHETFSPDELKAALKEEPNKFGTAFHFIVQPFYPFMLVE